MVGRIAGLGFKETVGVGMRGQEYSEQTEIFHEYFLVLWWGRCNLSCRGAANNLATDCGYRSAASRVLPRVDYSSTRAVG